MARPSSAATTRLTKAQERGEAEGRTLHEASWLERLWLSFFPIEPHGVLTTVLFHF